MGRVHIQNMDGFLFTSCLFFESDEIEQKYTCIEGNEIRDKFQ